MPAASYRDHLDTLMTRSAAALQRGGFDHLLIASGVEKYHFLDDRPYPFQVNPHFKHWLPLTAHPHSWLATTPPPHWPFQWPSAWPSSWAWHPCPS